MTMALLRIGEGQHKLGEVNLGRPQSPQLIREQIPLRTALQIGTELVSLGLFHYVRSVGKPKGHAAVA